jgi:hypothetical protein
VAAHSYHIDPKQAATDEELYVQTGGDPRVFKNFYIQRSYARDEDTQRPNHFDLVIESIGVVDRTRAAQACGELSRRRWRSSRACPFCEVRRAGIRSESPDLDSHTVGNLAQVLMYNAGLADIVQNEAPHPLKPMLKLHFNVKSGIASRGGHQPLQGGGGRSVRKHPSDCIMEFFNFEPDEYRVLEEIEFDETVQRPEKVRFYTLEDSARGCDREDDPTRSSLYPF